MSDRVEWNQGPVEKAVAEAALQGGRRFMEAVLTRAVDAAPVETGTLRRSGTVTVGGLPSGVSGEDRAFVGSLMQGKSVGDTQEVYTSFNTPYAIVMHEHSYKAKLAGGPKYLQRPFDAMKGQAQRFVEDFVKKVLSNG